MRKPYTSPELTVVGSVNDLTQQDVLESGPDQIVFLLGTDTDEPGSSA